VRRSTAAGVVAEALRVRTRLGFGLDVPVCPFDVASRVGLQIRYMSVPSLEGMYSPGPPALIIIGTERPPGRRNFTAAHEIGHHVFGHGDRIDEENDDPDGRAEEEVVADRFAGALLMPKLCVNRSFGVRQVRPASASAAQVYLVSKELGVGYTTLIGQLQTVLRLIPGSRATALSRVRPATIREELAGRVVRGDLVIVDRWWRRATVDLEVGDTVMLPDGGTASGVCLSLQGSSLEAVRAGEGSLVVPGSPTPVGVRVARRRFEGLHRWRFLEDPDDV